MFYCSLYTVSCLFTVLFVFTDLTVGDLSGTVTTIRASPLVMVVMEFEDFQTSLDLMDDRKCSVSDDIILLWYDVIYRYQ